MEKNYNSILWSGSETYTKRDKKNLGNLSISKCEGELDLRRVQDQNKVAIMKHFGAYLPEVVPYGWMGQQEFVEREKLLECENSTEQLWGWRNLIKLTGVARALQKFEMEEGSNIYLRLDWCFIQQIRLQRNL